jgi:hypothetical protein
MLLLPLAILQHLLVHPPELDMPSCAARLSLALLTLDPFLLLVATSTTTALFLLDNLAARARDRERRAPRPPLAHRSRTARPLDQALSAAQLLMPLLQMQLRPSHL